MVKERASMPAVGDSIDRRTFMHLDDVYSSTRVQQLVCLICTQSKTDMGVVWGGHANALREPMSDISYRDGKQLLRCYDQDPQSFERNLGFREFVKRYAAGHAAGKEPLRTHQS